MITVYSPNHNNTISIYSSVRPWKKILPESEIIYTNDNTLPPNDSKVLFMERPQTKTDVQMIRDWKAANKKVWIDHDDNVFCIPNYNNLKQFYDKMKPNIIESMLLADVITTCTESTANEWREVCKDYNKVHVLPVIYDETLWPMTDKMSRNKIIAWRGSITHKDDLWLQSRDLINFMNINTDWKLFMFGDCSKSIKDHVKNLEYIPQTDFETYKNKLVEVAPSIMFIPWVYNKFNAGKSEIAFYEATASGANFVCGFWGTYANVPAFHYYSDALEALNKAKDAVLSGDSSRWEHARKEMLYGRYSKNQRADILKDLLNS